MRDASTAEGRPDHHVVLSGPERDELSAHARELTRTPPALVDDGKWLAAAEGLAAAVPLRVRRAVRRFQHDPGEDGVLLLSNLWLDPGALPPTPARPGAVEREATLPAATQVLIAMCLGELVAYQNEKGGALVQNVVPVRGQEESQSNAGSELLAMHTENAFHPHRPDYVMLMCLRNDHENRAALQTGPLRRALPHLPAAVRDALRRPRFVTEAPPSFSASGAKDLHHAVLNGSPDNPDIIVDFHATRALDAEGRRALDALREQLVAAERKFVLATGDLAVLDNRVTLHGRSEFVPRYDGRDRWLHRTFVHLDARRSLGARVGDSQVIE
ncbi:TauD/TfdA family dioxygenase [Streptomyces sp. NPDC050560]|uniref:TauD/TfdA family dioxygenase n=1 Tax=Streptomyces sp. NPDC050560 TaxID=3365630 RepID=UPI00379B2B1D